MIIQINQNEAVKIIKLYLRNHNVKLLSDIEINHNDPYFTTFDVEADLTIIEGRKT